MFSKPPRIILNFCFCLCLEKMSFPRANIKRFNEATGCAPPPGLYDPKLNDRAHGGVLDKSDRFRAPKDVSDSSMAKTPAKQQLFAAPQSGKKVKSAAPADAGKIKELEKEIRRLMKEQGDKDRLLLQKAAEFKKRDGLSYKEIARVKDELQQVMGQMLTDLQKLEAHVATLEGDVQSYNELVSLVLKLDKSTGNRKREEGIPIDELSQKMKDEKVTVEAKLKLLKRKSENLQNRFLKALEDLGQGTKQLKLRYSAVLEENAKLVKKTADAQAQLEEAVQSRSALEEHRASLLDSNSCLKDKVQQFLAEQKVTSETLSLLSSTLAEKEENLSCLQTKFNELKNLHESQCKESLDRLNHLVERELVVSETTAGLHERLVELQAQNEDLAATLEETGELLSRTKDENGKLEEMLQQAEFKWELEKKQYLIQVEELMFEKSRAEGLINDAEGRVKELEADIVKQKSESDEQIQAINNQLETEKAELLQLQNKLGDLVFEKSKLHSEVGHLEAQLKLVRAESEETGAHANKAMEVIPELKQRIEELSNSKAVVEQKASELVEQNETLQQTLEKFQADFYSYSTKVECERKDVQTKIVSLTDEVEGLREQRDQMAKELDDWLTEKSELDIEVAKLQCRINVLEMENDQVREEKNKELESCKAEMERVTREKEQIEKDIEQYGIDLLSNAAQLQTLQAKLESKENEIKQLETEKQRLMADMKQLETRVRDSDAELSELQKSYEEKCTLCEDLVSDKERLQEDLQTQREQYEDLECRLQTTRADFLKRCSERDELLRKNEAKDKSLSVMSQQVSVLTQQLEQLTTSLEQKVSDCEKLTARCSEQEKELSLSVQQVSNFRQQIEDYKEHLQLKCEECDELQQKCDDIDVELTMCAKEAVNLQDTVEALKKEIATQSSAQSELVTKYGEEIEALKGQLERASSDEQLQADLDKYRTLYEELLAKVEPFLEQIDRFEMEKQILLGQNRNTQAEMERLGRNYAELLGHQNNKQKIKHIIKIKEENNALKLENQKLSEQVLKQKRQLEKFEEKNAPRRFDPVKAFKHSKENCSSATPKSPLRDANRR